MTVERIDLMAQRADLTLPYPPSVNHYFVHSIALRPKASAGQLARTAAAYSRQCSTWSKVAGLLRVNVFVGREGKQYRDAVASRVLMAREHGELQRAPLMGPLSARIVAHPSALKRKRDTDNLLKALLDALTHAQVYQDDSQLQDTAIAWGWPVREPRVRVVITRERPVTSEEWLNGSDRDEG